MARPVASNCWPRTIPARSLRSTRTRGTARTILTDRLPGLHYLIVRSPFSCTRCAAAISISTWARSKASKNACVRSSLRRSNDTRRQSATACVDGLKRSWLKQVWQCDSWWPAGASPMLRHGASYFCPAPRGAYAFPAKPSAPGSMAHRHVPCPATIPLRPR